MNLLLYALLTSTFFYLGSRAMITSWLWSRYPPRLTRFMDCPACTGFWYGLILAFVLGRYQHLKYLGLNSQSWVTPIIVGLCSITLTPIFAAMMQYALAVVGSVIDEDIPMIPADEDNHGRG